MLQYWRMEKERTMEKPQSKLSFMAMSLMFKIRDIVRPRKNVLAEAGIKPGISVLDFGCGPGGYLLPLYRLVGANGKIFALDYNPQAITSVKALIARHGLNNVEAILSDRATGLPDSAVDVVLLYDVFHHLEKADDILKEMHRVLKPGGILSVSDHHMTVTDIESGITVGGLFKLLKHGLKVHNFVKV